MAKVWVATAEAVRLAGGASMDEGEALIGTARQDVHVVESGVGWTVRVGQAKLMLPRYEDDQCVLIAGGLEVRISRDQCSNLQRVVSSPLSDLAEVVELVTEMVGRLADGLRTSTNETSS